MKNYKIDEIYIENFKHIKNNNVFLFNDTNLVILDGPNGFGKTTIFDAIELVTTGKISRIKNIGDGRSTFKDTIFQNDLTKDTIIKIKFKNEKEEFVIAKRFNSLKDTQNKHKKPDNFDLFETYILKNMTSEMKDEQISTNALVSEKLGLVDSERHFILYNYIQQEENVFFLKQNGKDRVNVISNLFDTKLEEEKKNNISKVLFKVNDKLSELNKEYIEKSNNKKELEKKINEINVENDKDVTYIQLFTDKEGIAWDKKELDMNNTQRNHAIIELNNILNLKNKYNSFLNYGFNKKLAQYSSDKLFLEKILYSSNFIDKYDEIIEYSNKIRKYEILNKQLIFENFTNEILNINIENFKGILSNPEETKEIEEEIFTLKTLKKNNGTISKTIAEINRMRNLLIDHFIIAKKEGNTSTHECPLCGFDWLNYDSLINQFEIKEIELKSSYDSTTQIYEEYLQKFYNNSIKKIIVKLEKFLNEAQEQIDYHFVKKLENSSSDFQKIIFFNKWCLDNNIDLSPFYSNSTRKINNIEIVIQSLVEKLISYKKEVDISYNTFEEDLITYNSFFKRNSNSINIITEEEVFNKIKYINFKFFNNTSELLKKSISECERLKEQISKYKDIQITIKDIIVIYKRSIQAHWKKIIEEVEIPFFIYSGKIIQDYQRGLGMFISVDKNNVGELKTLLFTTNINSDHDAINTLSSGQLSGLVISFTLALNKIYSNESLDILLIDDPVQSMDEINMSSFVEVLRNEFKNKQIILSTHEEAVSVYIRYKFSKYNISNKNINMKEKLYSLE